jgi:hypothetical protein
MGKFAESHNPLNKLHTAAAAAEDDDDDDDETLCHIGSHWDHRNCN